MAKERTFSIVINGLKESIDYVDSLNKQLDGLERRLNDLQGKTINISGGGASLPKASELSEIEKIEKEIAKVQEKQAAHQSEEYKALLMEKEALKQIESQAKASAKAMAGASNPNEINLNTMAGMKQRLRDLKLQHNNTDINSDVFKEQTREINELTQKLKELEAEYGVYSRNVGNYANSMVEGFNKLPIEINGVVQEFDNAKQALAELKKELGTLQFKQDEGIISEEEAERMKSLIPVVSKLKSSIEDAGKPMDAIMDTMQSIVAIVSAGKGIASFFGLDGNKVEESLKKLLALQNALQGLQTIQKQMQTGEGIGKYFASMNSVIDTGTKKLLVYNRAILGTGKAAKITAVSIKALGTALKSIGIGLVIAGIVQLIDLLDKWLHKGKEVTATMQAINDIVGQTGQGYAKAKANISMAQKAIDNFNGSAKEEKKLLEQLNSSTNGLVANCKNLDEAKQKIVEHADEYLEMMKLEAQAQALLSLYVQEYAKIIQKRQILSQQFSGSTFLNDMLDSVMQNEFKKADVYLDKVTDMLQQASDLRKQFFTEEKEETEKNQKDTVDSEEELQRLRIDAMKDGLNKRLMTLDEERRQTLNKLKGNQNAYLNAEKQFAQRRLDIIKEYNEQIAKSIENSTKAISSEKYNNAIGKQDIDRERILMSQPANIGLLTNKEIKEADNGLRTVAEYYATLEESYEKHLITQEELFKKYDENIKNLTKEQQDELENIYESTDGDVIKKKEEYYKAASEMLKSDSQLYKDYRIISENELSGTIESRLSALRVYNDKVLKSVKENLVERAKIEKLNYVKLRTQAKEEEDKRWEEEDAKLKEALSATSDAYLAQLNLFNQKQGELSKDEMKTFNKVEEARLQAMENYQLASQNHTQKLLNIQQEYDNNIKKLKNDTAAEISRIQSNYFDAQISNFREFTSKINNEISKQPIYDSLGFEIVNLSATKKNYKELLYATTVTFAQIKQEKENLSMAFRYGLLTPEAYNSILTQLNDIGTSTKEELETIQNNLENLGSELWKSINNWLQQVGQATTSILSSLSEITSNHYQEQINQQQEYLDKLSDLYDKQQDITQKHADALNDIEDELASARGDRRQQLIDALNEEMAAQRASLAQEKRIEAEQERAEKKRKELELDKAKAEKKMQEWQAGINALMAVSMAAVNHWPIPAIPMMAMAAAVGAAQLAAVKSKPLPKYAEGGVIQGKSHSQGGVKVLGGTSEVEGGEMIINKVTTNENTELLYHINSKKRRLNIDDFIDFYSSGKKTITSISPMRKYANGGQLPTMRTDIDLNDRLVTAFEEYANTPTVVSVVDIQNASERVNNVRVLSGLNV